MTLWTGMDYVAILAAVPFRMDAGSRRDNATGRPLDWVPSSGLSPLMRHGSVRVIVGTLPSPREIGYLGM